MHGNFHIVSYKDYPLIPDKKQPLPINVSVSDIRYQLVFEANDDIKCEELLLTWRAKPNGMPHKQTLPRWFYVDELVPFTDGSGKVAALQYKGHTKHEKMSPFDSSAFKVLLPKLLANEQYADLLPKCSPFLIKDLRELSRSLAKELIQTYQDELPAPINETNIVTKLVELDKALVEIENGYQVSVSGNELQLLWQDDLPTHEHPALLKQWAQDCDEIRTAYLDVFESDDELYIDDFLISLSDLLVQEPNDIEQSIATLNMLISTENAERFILVIRMADSDKALVGSLDLNSKVATLKTKNMKPDEGQLTLEGFAHKRCALDLTDPDYIEPTKEDFKALRELLGYNRNDLGSWLGIPLTRVVNSRQTYYKCKSIENWEKGINGINKHVWKLMLLKAGLVTV